MHESESEVAQSCPTLHDPMNCRLPGSSVHGIFQARVLEWGAIAFSEQCLAYNKRSIGTSLAVKWLRFHMSNAGDVCSIPGQGMKIPRAMWHGQYMLNSD